MRASRMCARAWSTLSIAGSRASAPCRCLRPPLPARKCKTLRDRLSASPSCGSRFTACSNSDARPLRQVVRRHKRGIVGLLSQRPAQPQMVPCTLAVEPHRLFAFVGGVIPALQREVDPAAQIVRLGRGGQANSKAQAPGPPRPPAKPHRPVARPSFGTSRPCARRKSAHQGDLKYLLHRTLLIGTPSCRGCPVVVPVATRSPSFSPETMATWVRLIAPVTTNVFFNSSPSIL